MLTRADRGLRRITSGTKKLRSRDRNRPKLQIEPLEARVVLDSTVVLNEIMYNPPGETDESMEWIELYNQLAVDVDISDWVLDGGVQFNFPDGTTVPGRGHLLVASDPTAFQAETGKAALGPFTGGLNNAGERLRLYNNDERLMNEVEYGVSGQWSTAPDGSGASLSKAVEKEASHLAENWTHSPEYGGTPGAANFMEPGSFVYEDLLPQGNPVQALVPFDLDNSLGQRWIDPQFDTDLDPTTWTVGTTGVGFDTGRSPIYLDYFGLDLNAPPDGQSPIPMKTGNSSLTSLYLRVPFQINSDFSDADQLTLNMRYDDGFVAYINGAEVASANAPGRDGNAGTLGWTSSASGSHRDSDAVKYERFNLMDFADTLVQGENVLAIHALNSSSRSDDDLLMDPQIVVGREVLPEAGIPIALNEISAGDEGEFWLELANDGDAPIDVGGMILAGTGDSAGEHTLPAQTLQPGDLLVVNQQQLGFTPADGDNIFLYSAGKESVVDGRQVTGRLRGRSDQFDGQWLYPATATAGAANSFQFQDDIVINEIMYHASPEQFSEAAKLPTYELTELVPLESNAWRYRDSSEPLPSGWAGDSHDGDAQWQTGQGAIGMAASTSFRDDVNTSVAIPGLSGSPFHTYYFEHDIEFTGSDLPYDFQLKHHVHGGAVFYVNGVEIARYNMPDGPIAADTPASEKLRSRNIGVSDPLVISADLLTEGTNRISVELHRHDLTDLNFFLDASVDLREEVKPGVPAKPFAESDEEWIELYNRGTASVDIGGWRLSEAVDYEFAAGTVIQPGQYLVVANDSAALAAKNPNIQIVGNFNGTLSNHDDRILLSDTNKNPADRVHYYESGRWSALADGGGSSLELRSPNTDNSKPEAWAASDETMKSEWQTYTYRKAALQDPQSSSRPAYQEFIIGMLDNGEFLIDDITVVHDPDGEAKQLIQNGTFTGDTLGDEPDKWRLMGTHAGTVVADPDDPTNKVLHMVATGPHAYPHDHAETTFADGERTVPDDMYEITYRAKWLAGSPQVNTRLFFSRAALTTNLVVPNLNGTPGAQNSTYEANVGPAYEAFRHSPATPAENQEVTVTVQADDPDGVDSVTLLWRTDGGDWNSVNMSAAEGGVYTGQIPGQSSGERVQFYVEGRDSLGQVSTFPAGGRASRALYQVEDLESRKPNDLVDTIKVIVLEEDHDELYPPNGGTNEMSNQNVPGTLVHNNDVFYDVGVRQTGSRFIRPNSGIKIRMNPDQAFFGVHDSIRFKANLQYEIAMKQMINRAGGNKASMYDDIAYLIQPHRTSLGSSQTFMALLQLARYEGVYLDEQFENGSDGAKFEMDDVVWGTHSGNVEGTKTGTGVNTSRDIGINARAVAEQGFDKEFYRGHIMIHSQRARDDYDAIIRMGQAIHLTGDELDAATQEAMDVDIWMRHYATQSFLGNWDTYGFGRPKNLRVYVRPEDGKVMPMAWDSDRGNFTDALYARSVGVSRLDEIRDIPSNRRLFWGHMLDLINRGFNEEYLTPWASHFNELIDGQGGSAGGVSLGNMARLVGSRATAALSQMENPGRTQGGIAKVPFEITTNGGQNFQVDTTAATLEGTGWIDVRNVRLAGSPDPLTVEWTDEDSWQIRLPMAQGENAIALEAYDYQDNLITTDTITVTSTVANPVVGFLRVTEVNYNPYDPTPEELAVNANLNNDDFEYVELKNTGSESINLLGAQFSDGIVFQFPEMQLAAGETGVLVRNTDAFALRYGSEVNVLGQYSSGLNNTGERLVLVDGQMNTIMNLDYADSDPWPEAADGLGATLQLVDAANTSPATHGKHYAWRASTEIGGTPGTDGAAPVGVVINEVLANTDATPNLSDAIELHNTTPTAIDIGGWYLSDSANSPLKFQIPVGTTLAPFGYAVFGEDAFNPTPANPGSSHFGLSGANGDDVWLVIPDGSGGVQSIVDEVHFGATAAGESLGLTDDGMGRLVPLTSVTLGAVNATPRVGPVVLTEINYNPGLPTASDLAIHPTLTSDDLEFVEVTNTSSAAIDLTEWRLRGGADFDFAAGMTLGIGNSLLIVSFSPADPGNASRLAAFRAHYGINDTVALVGGYQGQLSDSGEIIRLERPGVAPQDDPTAIPRLMEDEVLYDNLAPWPTQAAGLGQSLDRLAGPAPVGSSASSWTAANPSPGTSNFSSILPGDSNMDGKFNQLDLVLALQGGKYMTGRPATFPEGDWNGDGLFDQDDIVAALQAGSYDPVSDAAFASLDGDE